MNKKPHFQRPPDPDEVLQLCADTKSLKDRKQILATHDSVELRNILLYTYNPLFMYYPNKDVAYEFATPMTHGEDFKYCINHMFYALDEIIAENNKDKPDIKRMKQEVFKASANLSVRQQTIFQKILQKDLGFKLCTSTVNEVFKRLIPELKLPKISYIEFGQFEAYPAIIEPICNGDIVIALTRHGRVHYFDENSAPVTIDSKYDEELLKCFGDKKNLLCVMTTGNKLIVHDVLTIQELRHGVYSQDKVKTNDYYKSVFEAVGKLKLVEKSEPVIVYSKREYTKLVKENKNKRLLGYMFRSLENQTKFFIEVK